MKSVPEGLQGLAACQAAQRAVRREEVPCVEFRFTMNPEARFGRGGERWSRGGRS